MAIAIFEFSVEIFILCTILISIYFSICDNKLFSKVSIEIGLSNDNFFKIKLKTYFVIWWGKFIKDKKVGCYIS